MGRIFLMSIQFLLPLEKKSISKSRSLSRESMQICIDRTVRLAESNEFSQFILIDIIYVDLIH